MQTTVKGFLAGALALAGATLATTESQAMPIQPLSPAASVTAVEPVFFYGYGYRRPFYRYGYRRPFFGYRRFGFRPYYGFRRPFYGYRRF